jgi:lactate dehydrogenase-like 2-hydroxyacid dehydrogenase
MISRRGDVARSPAHHIGRDFVARAADARDAALIDKRALARMKAIGVSDQHARGPVIDEAALAWALQQHLIAGAALDVYEKRTRGPCRSLPLENVLLVPHLASGTTETRSTMAELAIDNVI